MTVLLNIRKITPLLLLVGSLFSQEAFSQSEYVVKGKIEGWPSKYIRFERKGNFPGKDSVENKDGSFEFRGKIEGPTNAFLVSLDGEEPKYKFLFLEPGNIEIHGQYANLEEAKVTGSKSTDEYYEIKNIHKTLGDQIDSLYQVLGNEKDETKTKSISNEIKSLTEKNIEISKTFIKEHPSSPATVYELAGLSQDLSYTELKKLYDLLDPKLIASVQAEDINAYMKNLANIEIGKIAPDIAQKDTAGNTIKLQDFRGKYVLVDFWASWCIPCRRENPNLLAAYKSYKDKGFEILGVSIDSKAEEWRWKRAIENDGVIWPQISDLQGNKNEAAVTYAVQVIPSNFLIGPDGKIIAKNLVGEKLQEKLKEIFK